jgi:type I restriction enzyme R subunit
LSRSEEGATLTGVEVQATKYPKGLPAGLPCWARPLPFTYESTDVETRFTRGLDPVPRSCLIVRQNRWAMHQ